MRCLENFLIISATVFLSDAVRINMKGSVSLGKDIIDTLSQFMHRSGMGGQFNASRRFMTVPGTFAEKSEDRIKWTITASDLGRDLKSCSGVMGEFLKDYATLLANAVESIFKGILTINDLDKENEGAIFVDQLKPILIEINEIVKSKNDKILGDKQEWIVVLKLISSKFQKYAMIFVDERLDGDPQDIANVKKKLGQKLIIAIVLVENKYETKLCSDFSICEKEHEVTKALHTLLLEFQKTDNKKAMDFVKIFYENLPNHALRFLNADTLHEFQFILSDLSYSTSAPTRAVLLSVYKTVDARLQYLENLEEMSKAYDQQIVNVILSDMDAIYSSKRKAYPFDNFLGPFNGWMRLGGKFTAQIRHVIKDIQDKLKLQHEGMIEKLANEVRVFLELTVDPEN